MRGVDWSCALETSRSSGEYGFATVRRGVFVPRLIGEFKRHPILGVDRIENARREGVLHENERYHSEIAGL